MSSGPAPRPLESTTIGDADNAFGGAAGARPGETNPVNNSGASGGSGKTKSNVSAAGHTYDKGYDKWAKFDIDAALRDVDDEDAEAAEKVWDEA